jgi:hypothetical protein
MRALLLLLAAVLVAGCGGGSEATSPTGTAAETEAARPAPPATAAQTEAARPAPPATAPETEASRSAVRGPGLDGGEISLDDFRGTAVLVNVWSSW